MQAQRVIRSLSQGLVIAALVACGLLAALLGGPAPGAVAAVFPPWWSETRAVNAAAEGGSVLRFGALSFIVLVAPDAPRGRERLWRAGAWLLLNPRGLAACGWDIGAKSNGNRSATRG